MIKILLAEDSAVQSKVIATQLQRRLDAWIVICCNYEDVKSAIKEANSEFTIGLVNLVMPGAEDGEAIELCLNSGIPTVVITSSFSPHRRREIFSWRVLDYVVKDGPASVGYLVDLVHRLVVNPTVKVLVAEDSPVTRNLIRGMLEDFQLTVFDAPNGREALKILRREHGISLLVTDYEMPEMDGAELIREARLMADRQTLAIIGLSASDDETLSARLLKAGANDFLHKPLLREEFLCRVCQNIEFVENIAALKRAATRDYLTGLANRRHFFDVADDLMRRRDNHEATLSLAMMDIDHFKSVNDTYGHDAGDEALKLVAEALSRQTRFTDLLARLGGEEFCVVGVDVQKDDLRDFFETFRKAVESIHFEYEGTHIPLTVSIGVSSDPCRDIHGMIMEADEMLYAAKEGGRNQVALVGDDVARSCLV